MTGKWVCDIVLLAFHLVKDIKVYDRPLTGNGFREIPKEQSRSETNDTIFSHDGYTYDLLVSGFTYIHTYIHSNYFHHYCIPWAIYSIRPTLIYCQSYSYPLLILLSDWTIRVKAFFKKKIISQLCSDSAGDKTINGCSLLHHKNHQSAIKIYRFLWLLKSWPNGQNSHTSCL